jgi:hypothetical protein
MSDGYKIELNLTHKEYGRAELVTHLGIAYGFFGVESTDDVTAYPQRQRFQPHHLLVTLVVSAVVNADKVRDLPSPTSAI